MKYFKQLWDYLWSDHHDFFLWAWMNEHSYLLNSLLVGAVCLLFIVCIIGWAFAEELVTIDQFGYVEGSPDQVVCERCGKNCHFIKNQKKDGELWTEWACPSCVKLPV